MVSNNEKKKLIKGITDKEIEMLKAQKEFRNKKMEGNLKQIFIESEEGQFFIDNAKWNIGVKLQRMKEMKLMILRNEVQIKGKDVWRHLDGYPDVKLTEDELKVDIEGMKFKIETEVSGIKTTLGKLIGYVGELRVDRKVLMTEEEFEKYFKEIDSEVKKITGKGILNG